MNKVLLTILLLLTSYLSFPQSCASLMKPISLEDRSSEATLIIEAEVISQESYWDTQHKNIYTLHELQVYKNAKGVLPTTVYVETQGGRVGDEMQITSSAASLHIRDLGVFFLKSSNVSFSNGKQTFQMVAAAQGYVKYDKVNNTASDVFNKYTSITTDLFPKLESATNRSIQVVREQIQNKASNSVFAIPVITSFTPTTASAGTETTITIYGSSFGTTLGKVLFPTGNDGGVTYTAAKDSQIVIWSDTSIIVKVPYTAGTGTIQVLNTSGTTTSTGTLTIPFSHSNASTSTTHYPRTIESSGGVFTFDYHTDFDISAAKPYFEQAFGLWNCQSGINFAFGSTTTTDVSADDGINIVRFDNGAELSSGVLGQVTSRVSLLCNATGDALVREMDITWNDDYNFYYGDGTPSATQFDFKTVALHELGHAHQLNHIINPINVMHYGLSVGESKFSLSSDDIDGANYTMFIFTEASQCSPMTTNSQCTYVPDDNFEAYLEANSMGNGISGDDLVTTANISGITFLSVSSQGISDFTGIEDFIALETLFALSNTMSSLDLTFNVNLKDFRASSSASLATVTINALTALETLDLASTSITTIDVSNNTALKTFWLGSTTISTLDVSNNTTLEFLHLTNNTAITSLDLTVNTALKSFYAQNSGLNSLNLKNGNNGIISDFTTTGSSSLTCIKVDDAAYSITNWTSIDATTSFDETCLGTYVPDDNFEQALIDLGHDDVLDDYVVTGNINTLTSLSVTSKGIVDFTGIEDFISLTHLYVTGNSNTTMDVSPLTELVNLQSHSNNNLISLDVSGLTKLETLRINNTRLTSLNVTTNTALSFLWAFNISTLATNVDVTNNIALENLHLNGTNQSGNLDFSHLINLTSLYIANNDITGLNVNSGNSNAISNFEANSNTNLTCINVDDAVYSTANWTTIDAQTSFSEHCNDTYVPDDNFENYLETHNASGTIVTVGDASSMGNGVANDNYVLTIAISNVINLDVRNKSIADLTGIEDFTLLESLLCSSNSLTSLDVTQNINLTDFSCHSNSLTNLDVTQNSALIDLSCGSNDITNLDITQNLLLDNLSCSDNQLTGLDVSQNLNLIQLSIYENQIAVLDVSQNSELTYFYTGDNLLTSLDLSNNPMLDEFEAYNNLLNSLDLRNGNNLGISVSDFNITNNPNLACVLVDDPAYSTTNWTSIDAHSTFSLDCIQTYVPDDNFENYLETHDASGTIVSVGDATSMGNGVANDDYVLTIAISNVINLGVSSLSIADLTGIEDFTALETLYCRSNNLTSLDITQNVNLETLYAYDNILLTALDVTQNPLLKTLSIHDCPISSIDLSQNVLLENFDCESNGMTSLDFTQNPQLKYFYAQYNNLVSLDLTQNILLLELDLRDNQLTSIDISQNSVLEEFYINDNDLSSLNAANGNNTNISDFYTTENPNLTCVLVDDASWSTTNWTYKDVQTIFNDVSCSIMIAPKVYLQGAALNPNSGEESLMRDDLRIGDGSISYIPTTSPYADGLTCNTSVFTPTGNDAIVDWIWVELRDKTDNTIVIDSQSALLQRDGGIVGVDGVSLLSFSLSEDDYYVVINHRNHLGIMTANTVALSSTTTVLDFTDATNEITYGTSAQSAYGMPTDMLGMGAGDANSDKQVGYNNAATDINTIQIDVLLHPSNTTYNPAFGAGFGYYNGDINMDGKVSFSASDSDLNTLQVIVLLHPLNTTYNNAYDFITEQLPQ